MWKGLPDGGCSADCLDSPEGGEVREAPADLEDQSVRVPHEPAADLDEVEEHDAQAHPSRNPSPAGAAPRPR